MTDKISVQRNTVEKALLALITDNASLVHESVIALQDALEQKTEQVAVETTWYTLDSYWYSNYHKPLSSPCE